MMLLLMMINGHVAAKYIAKCTKVHKLKFKKMFRVIN